MPLFPSDLLCVNLSALHEAGALSPELLGLLRRAAVDPSHFAGLLHTDGDGWADSSTGARVITAHGQHTALDLDSPLSLISAVNVLYAAGAIVITGVFCYWYFKVLTHEERLVRRCITLCGPAQADEVWPPQSVRAVMLQSHRRVGWRLVCLCTAYTAIQLCTAASLAAAGGSALITGGMAMAAAVNAAVALFFLVSAFGGSGIVLHCHVGWPHSHGNYMPPSEEQQRSARWAAKLALARACLIQAAAAMVVYARFSPFPGLLALAWLALFCLMAAGAWAVRRNAPYALRPTLMFATALYALVAGAASYSLHRSPAAQMVALLAALPAASAAVPLLLWRRALRSRRPPQALDWSTAEAVATHVVSHQELPLGDELTVLLPYWLFQLGLLVGTLRMGTLAAIPYALSGLSACMAVAPSAGLTGFAVRLGSAAYLLRVCTATRHLHDPLLLALLEALGLGHGDNWLYDQAAGSLRVCVAGAVHMAVLGAAQTTLDMVSHGGSGVCRTAVERAAWEQAGPATGFAEVALVTPLLWLAALSAARAAAGESLLGVGGLLYAASLVLFAVVCHLAVGLAVALVAYAAGTPASPPPAPQERGGSSAPQRPRRASLAVLLQSAYRRTPFHLLMGRLGSAGWNPAGWAGHLGGWDSWLWEASRRPAAGAGARGGAGLHSAAERNVAFATTCAVLCRYVLAASAATSAAQGGDGSMAAACALLLATTCVGSLAQGWSVDLHLGVELAAAAGVLLAGLGAQGGADGARALTFLGVALAYAMIFRLLRRLARLFDNQVAFYGVVITVVGWLTCQLGLYVASRDSHQGSRAVLPLELRFMDGAMARVLRAMR